MIDEKELALWIARLETEESSWQNYERLATLYIVRDHQNGNVSEMRPLSGTMYSAAAEPTKARKKENSEFLRVATNGDPEKTMEVMDELMETLKVINRRVYDNVLQKLERL